MPRSASAPSTAPAPAARLVVDAVELVGALLGVGDGGEQQQPDGGDDEHGGEQPRAQGGHHVRGVRSA